MAAPVGEVEGGSWEHEPEGALQVLLARAGREDHLRSDLQKSRLRQGGGDLSRTAPNHRWSGQRGWSVATT